MPDEVLHKADLIGRCVYGKPWTEMSDEQKEMVREFTDRYNAAAKTPADAWPVREAEAKPAGWEGFAPEVGTEPAGPDSPQ